MKSFISGHKYFFLLLLVFIVAEFIVAPIGDFPLNDDWSYAKAVRTFNNTGEFNFGVWPAMTLCSHILWGSLFTKLFGFSHFVLRISTLISAIIGLIFLYKLIIRVNGKKPVAAIICAAVVFNPMFFNLTNTFMTDVNFCTLTIICCYYIYRFHESGKMIFVIPVFIFSTLLVLVRQFGILAPLCFMASCIAGKEKKWRNFLGSLAVFVLVMLVYKIYEGYLERILPKGAAYKFSGNFEILSGEFWSKFFKEAWPRFLIILLHLLVYALPVSLLILKNLIQKSGRRTSVLVIVLCFVVSLFLFYKQDFPYQNIFSNMNLGPETFYESTQGVHHAFSSTFAIVMQIIKYAGAAITLSVIVLSLLRSSRSERSEFLSPFMLYNMMFILGYSMLLFISESSFDRYHLPIIVIFIVILARLMKNTAISFSYPAIILACMLYISIAGTKDYFTLNEKRWEAYDLLHKNGKVPSDSIHGGFEVMCWNEPDFQMSFDYLKNEKLFLIQFSKEPGYELLKEYEFQRYFPYKKDKINIFVREAKK